MTLGVSIPDGQPKVNLIQAELDAFIAKNGGIKPTLYTVWSQWGHRGGNQECPASNPNLSCDFPTDILMMLDSYGIDPVVWWEPIDPANPTNGFYARHKQTYKLKNHDKYIRDWADAAKAFGLATGRKTVIRLAHEANGTWFPWVVGYKDNTPRTFKKFWRYVYNKFKSRGALKHVKFLWSVTNRACKGCNPYKAIFPGRAYVDYVGITAFNWGAQRKWKPMIEQLKKPLAATKAVAGKKPVIIAELASHFRPTSKSKAAWLKNGYKKTYSKWPRVKAIMYLNSDQPKKDFGHPDWRLDKPNDGSAYDAHAYLSGLWKFKGTLD